MRMADILGNLRIDKKVKEASIMSSRYTDTKTFVQFWKEVENRIIERERARMDAYEKAIAQFEPYKDIVTVNDHKLTVDLKGLDDFNKVNDALMALQNAMIAADALDRSKKALEYTKRLSSYIENEGTKEGLNEIRHTIQDNPVLLALALSTKEEHETAER